MTAHVKLSSQWSTVDQIYARVGGSWKEVAEGYVRLSGAWEPFFASGVALTVDYLVIAGGGSGGNTESFSLNGAGGGGAGGYRCSVSGESSGGGAAAETPLSLAVSTNYTVTIGAGAPAQSAHAAGTNGSNSVFATITSLGGGQGFGGSGVSSIAAGGSGGGGGAGTLGNVAGGLGTAGQGFNGDGNSASTGNGGGGAGAAGSGATGGTGVSSSITGSSVTRAGGGGASNTGSGGAGGGGAGGTQTGTNGTVNTGGGGGGAGPTDNATSGAGGSGVVILKYPDTYAISVGPGLSHRTTTSGGYRVTTFTAGTGNVSFSEAITSDFELIETVQLTANQASVTFDVTGLGATYKHLQIRYAVRTSRTNNLDGVTLRLNNDTAGNYSYHRLFGSGSSVTSDAVANASFIYVSLTSDASSTGSAFGVGVIDILDAYNTNKFTTVRTLGGVSIPTNPYISLMSGAWRNTASLTSITLDQTTGPNFVAGCRLSIYGVKG